MTSQGFTPERVVEWLEKYRVHLLTTRPVIGNDEEENFRAWDWFRGEGCTLAQAAFLTEAVQFSYNFWRSKRLSTGTHTIR